eukprot:scaffold60393_cov28-Tisochrysis_lutea.AAC.1
MVMAGRAKRVAHSSSGMRAAKATERLAAALAAEQRHRAFLLSSLGGSGCSDFYWLGRLRGSPFSCGAWCLRAPWPPSRALGSPARPLDGQLTS